MSGNSNPSINSPASSNHDLDTLVGDDAIIAANLLQEFNDRQARHISVSSSESEVQYVPHSPTPSVQELLSPPPLRVRITAEGVAHFPPYIPWDSCDPPPHGGRLPHQHHTGCRQRPHRDHPPPQCGRRPTPRQVPSTHQPTPRNGARKGGRNPLHPKQQRHPRNARRLRTQRRVSGHPSVLPWRREHHRKVDPS